MTVEGALPFPGSRTLANWRRQLVSWQPGALWVGHVVLHRVEALARCTVVASLEPLQALLLRALAVTPGQVLQALQARLHLDRQVLERLLHALNSAGLARPERGWEPTELGRQALDQGTHPRQTLERRVFYFVDSEFSASLPHFLPLADPLTLPWAGGHDWRFDVDILSSCVAQPLEWKRRFGFPLDVDAILQQEPAPGTLDGESWRRVVVDRPERLVALLALVPAASGEKLVGFEVRQDGWTLMTEKPIFAIAENWADVFPELAVQISQQAWRDALQSWSRANGLTALEADALRVEQQGLELRVEASAGLLNRLHSQGEAPRTEVWLLAGTSRFRAAATLRLEERTDPA